MAIIATNTHKKKFSYLKKIYDSKITSASTDFESKVTRLPKKIINPIKKKDILKDIIVIILLLTFALSGYLLSKYIN